MRQRDRLAAAGWARYLPTDGWSVPLAFSATPSPADFSGKAVRMILSDVSALSSGKGRWRLPIYDRLHATLAKIKSGMTIMLLTLSVHSSVDKSASRPVMWASEAGFLWVAETLGSGLNS